MHVAPLKPRFEVDVYMCVCASDQRFVDSSVEEKHPRGYMEIRMQEERVHLTSSLQESVSVGCVILTGS